jgi:hypothetical protein
MYCYCTGDILESYRSGGRYHGEGESNINSLAPFLTGVVNGQALYYQPREIVLYRNMENNAQFLKIRVIVLYY